MMGRALPVQYCSVMWRFVFLLESLLGSKLLECREHLLNFCCLRALGPSVSLGLQNCKVSKDIRRAIMPKQINPKHLSQEHLAQVLSWRPQAEGQRWKSRQGVAAVL